MSFGDILKIKGEVEEKLKNIQETMARWDNREKTTQDE